VSLALQRRLRTLSAEFEKGASRSDSRIVLKTGTKLLRQWRGHVHTVLVGDDGFEYEGQYYRSLTVIAQKITGALVGPAVLWPDQARTCFGRRRSQPMTRSAGSSTRRKANEQRIVLGFA
jgi:Protein of unknown function (DUF2924)